MILKVAGKKVDFFEGVNVTLKYDGIASTFGFAFPFDPENPDHKEICRPLAYHDCTVEYNGETLITGTILSPKFTDSATPGMVAITGYSKTGVLEDCSIPLECYPLQSDSINLKDITERVLKPFGLKLIVDPLVADDVNKKYKNSTGGDTQSCKGYLSELASQRNIILTHDNLGNVVMTRAKASQSSVYDFSKETKGVVYDLEVNGQSIHSTIHVQKQQTKKKAGAKGDSAIKFIKAFRPKTLKQTSTDDLNTDFAARNSRAEELASIKLNIDIEGWELSAGIIRPNTIITVLNPSIYLYNRTAFFVESVTYSLNAEGRFATLQCVLPEVYNGKEPKNIFL